MHISSAMCTRPAAFYWEMEFCEKENSDVLLLLTNSLTENHRTRACHVEGKRGVSRDKIQLQKAKDTRDTGKKE